MIAEASGVGQHRPVIAGTHAMVSSGHSLASLAGVEILKAGGNAFDAGVAVHLALCILQPDYVGFVGVAPFMGYSAQEGRVVSYSGLGVAPKRATIEFFRARGYTTIPDVGILAQLIPATVDTDVSILQRYGRLSFGRVAAAALNLAEHGFPAHRFMSANIKAHAANIERFPYNASIFFQTGGPPKLNDMFFQKDAARSLRLLVNAEQKALVAGKTRQEALEAVRDVFYKGEIAHAIVKLHQEQGGLFTYDDLATYRGTLEEPLMARFKGYEFYTNSTWNQGPLIVQILNILKNFDLQQLGHNSAEYVHVISQAINLAMADREKFYGDPAFVKVPAGLWSEEYGRARAKLIDMRAAFQELPPFGDPEECSAMAGRQPLLADRRNDDSCPRPDTTYLAVVDEERNAFSMTPSDGGLDSPMVPGYGITLGTRLIQLRLDPEHPAALAPGKRPRLTPNPGLVMKDGKPFMPIGTPGGDQQAQAMLQVFLNVAEFGMNVQEAIEAPRFGSYNFPDSFAPHPYYPGRLSVEARLEARVGEALRAKGHKVHQWEDWTALAGAVCAVLVERSTRVLTGGADPRREAYAIGW
jgi:gamma-glutamyltranspeptidase/glutathione hydrolase